MVKISEYQNVKMSNCEHFKMSECQIVKLSIKVSNCHNIKCHVLLECVNQPSTTIMYWFSVFFLLLQLKPFVGRESAIRYKIESVRIPKERVRLYSRGKYTGPDDIALVRTRERVVFVPGRIMPVKYLCILPSKIFWLSSSCFCAISSSI